MFESTGNESSVAREQLVISRAQVRNLKVALFIGCRLHGGRRGRYAGLARQEDSRVVWPAKSDGGVPNRRARQRIDHLAFDRPPRGSLAGSWNQPATREGKGGGRNNEIG